MRKFTFPQKTFSLIFPAICLLSSQISAEEAKKYQTITAAFGERDLRLNCPASPDAFHSVYWLPETGHGGKPRVVGSGAVFDHRKYTYLASTGQLLLKNVTEEDEGLYKCLVISKSRATSIIDAGSLYLTVKRSYSSFWEKELKENIRRAGVAAGLAGGTLVAICLVYSCRHKGSKTDNGSFGHPSRGHYEVSPPAASVPNTETMKSPAQPVEQSEGEEESAPAVTLFTNHSINIGVNTAEVKPVPPGSTIIYISPTH